MPIQPNLMVDDMDRALEFWCGLLGFEVAVAVDADRAVTTDGTAAGAVFVTLSWQESELMLQAAGSLRSELPGILADGPTPPRSAVYLVGHDPHAIASEVPPEQVIKGPVQQWYGMTELYLHDPDGHIVCLATPEGPAPEI